MHTSISTIRVLVITLLIEVSASSRFRTANTCETDEDCSLNGICLYRHTRFNKIDPKPNNGNGNRYGEDTIKVCNCDAGWSGEDCGTLDLEPAKRNTGYNHTDATNPNSFGKSGNSSWGGQILQDPTDKRIFHLFVDQFGNGCGLSGWRPNSFIIRAESMTGPQGPFHYAQTVAPAFRHNAYIFYSPADNKYLLYAIGVDVPTQTKCGSVKWPNNVSVSSAQHIRGPWTPMKLALNTSATNPAPWPLWSAQHPTSKILLGVEDNSIYIADKWNGNYELVKIQKDWNTSDYSSTWTEDPFFWRDKRGNWHVLNHWLIDVTERGEKFPRVGAHMFARNLSGRWTFKQQAAFTSNVTFDDGSSEIFKRRERPKLFFSDDGEMTPL